MNKVLEYIIRAKDMTKSGISSALTSVKNLATGIGRNLMNIKAGFDMVAGVVRTVGGVIASAIAESFKFEKAVANFKVLLGSVDEAKTHIADLKNFAASTPLTFDDLSQASKLLLSFGASVDSIMPSLKMLGDISMGDAQKFQGLALVFAQVKSAGKLMGQDLLQMINQGFNPLTVIAKETGQSVSELKDLMSEGGISFEMVAEAMRLATSEGGLFNNAMKESATTGEGLISTLKDNWSESVRQFGNVFAESAKGGIQFLIDKLKSLNEDGTIAVWADKAVSACAKIASAFKTLAPVVSTIWKTIVGTFDALGSEIGRFAGAISMGNFADAFGGIGTETARAFTDAFDLDGKQAAKEEEIKKTAQEKAQASKGAEKAKDAKPASTKSLSQMLEEGKQKAAEEKANKEADKLAEKEEKAYQKALEQYEKEYDKWLQDEEKKRIKLEKKIHDERVKLQEAELQEYEQAYSDAQADLADAQAKVQQAWGWYRDKDSLATQIAEEKADAEAWKQYEKDFDRLRRRRKDWRTADNLSLDDEAVRRVALAREEEAAAAQAVLETAENTARAAAALEVIRDELTED